MASLLLLLSAGGIMLIILLFFHSLIFAETTGGPSALAQRMAVPSYNAQSYRHIGWLPSDPNLRNVYIKLYEANQVDRDALRNAFQFYQQNSCAYNSSNPCCRNLNPNTMAISDFTRPSTDDRLHLINLRTGTVMSMQTAHGANSGPQRGPASNFSNSNGSHQTPAGFHVARGVYTGGNGLSLNMHGLESRNSNSYSRRIVIHAANYVAGGGRSHGCLAVEPSNIRTVVDLLKDEGLIYNFNGETSVPATEQRRSCPR